MKVRDIMTTPVITATPDTTFPQLIDDMIEHNISGLPIIDDRDRLVGIVTEADLVSKGGYGGTRRRAMEYLADLVAGGRTKWAVKGRGHNAGEVMTKAPVTGLPDEDIRVISRRMVERGVKRLPVVDSDDQLVGIVSRVDLLRTMHRSDEELAADVAALLDDVMRAPEEHEVTADVDDGIVILTGTVKYPVDLAVLSRLVWRLPAVVDVRNECSAREADPRLETYRSPLLG